MKNKVDGGILGLEITILNKVVKASPIENEIFESRQSR